MFKKLISALTLTAIVAAYALTPAFADGLEEPEGTTSDTAAVTEDVVEMADRIVETEGEILVMSDRIVETEEIVAVVSPSDEFDAAALDASAETREVMEYGALPNELDAVESLVPDADVPVVGDTVVGLSDDIGEMADDKVAAKAPESKPSNRAGLVVSALTSEQKSVLKIDNGVLVEEVNGPAGRAGIENGDVILAVNNQEVNNVEEFDRLINDPARKSAALLVKRGEDAHYVSVRLDR